MWHLVSIAPHRPERMKMKAPLTATLLLLVSSTFGQIALAQKEVATRTLNVEIRVDSNNVRFADDILVSIFFRSPDRVTTLWNAFGWGGSAGFYLQVSDADGREIKTFTEAYDVLPPDETGRDA